MTIAILILALFNIAAGIIALREFSRLQKEIDGLLKAIDNHDRKLLTVGQKSSDITINDVPVSYDKDSKTVCVEGNLVATGFIACAGKGGDCDA